MTSFLWFMALPDDSIKHQRAKQEDLDTSPNEPPPVPWMTPSQSYQSATDPNPYSHTSSDQFQEHPKSYQGHGTGFGYSNRPSELDLSYMPDAFISTSSLDLLGTIAEMKLPSAKSLENIQKYGMDGIGPSTASLGDWYSMFPDTNNHSPGSDPQSTSRNFDPPQNRLMPWNLNGVSNPAKNSPRSTTTTSNNANNSNGNGNGNMKHSLSRELLQAVADAEAHDEAQSELENLVKLQQLEKFKQEAQLNSSNRRTNANASQSPPSSSSPPDSVVDARRTSSIENFMSVLFSLQLSSLLAQVACADGRHPKA
jgi:hypothetical protein